MSAVTTTEIPREEWVSFFNAFSRRHDGWLVNVEILGAEFGAQIEAKALRFAGINADLKDHEDRIMIDLDASHEAVLTHTIDQPTHIWLGQSQTEFATCQTLDIESVSGNTTLVRFLAGVEPNRS